MAIQGCGLGIEVSEDRLHTSIGFATLQKGEELVTIGLVAYLDGTQSGLGEVLCAIEELSPVAIVIDPRSHAATLIHPLDEKKVKKLFKPQTGDVVVAHGNFLDDLTAGKLRHMEHPRLTAAARAGQQRRLSGAHAWDRRNETDMSPLTAVTLALWGLRTAKNPLPPLSVS